MRTTIMAGMAALLLSLPVAAQQATPQTPAPPGTPAPRGPGAGPMGGPGGQDHGRMGMMGRPGMHDEDEDEDHGGPMRGRHHGHRRHGAPMQVIINVGPDIRVEFEEREARGAGMGRMGGPMMRGEMRGRPMADRIGARLDHLRGELQLTPEQQQAWDRFASAVREAIGRARPSFEAMAQAQTLDQRLTAQEGVLTARLEAVRAIRSALSGLTGSLTDAQRRTLDEHAAAFIPGMGRMRAGMMR